MCSLSETNANRESYPRVCHSPDGDAYHYTIRLVFTRLHIYLDQQVGLELTIRPILFLIYLMMIYHINCIEMPKRINYL